MKLIVRHRSFHVQFRIVSPAFDTLQSAMTESQQTSDTVNPTKHVGALLILAALGVTVLGLTSGRMVAEKVVSDMAMPCGVTWLTLTMVCYFALVMRQRFLFLISFFAWLLLT